MLEKCGLFVVVVVVVGFVLLSLCRISLCNPEWCQTHHIAQADLQFMHNPPALASRVQNCVLTAVLYHTWLEATLGSHNPSQLWHSVQACVDRLWKEDFFFTLPQ